MENIKATGNLGEKTGQQQPGKQQGGMPGQDKGLGRKEDPSKKDIGGDFGRERR